MLQQPDPEDVLSGLKNFQRETVEYVFQRMYTDPNPTNRFLVADEVGLGKTMVAKGLIAKAIDHLWETKERIDVVYICSNADIARQNINRLRVGAGNHFALASRITMLPTKLQDLKNQKLNFISFTPGTSFDLKHSMGMMDERALLCLLLEKAWGLSGKGFLNLFQGYVTDPKTFRDRVKYLSTQPIDAGLGRAFAHSLDRHIALEQAGGADDLRSRFDYLCDCFKRFRKHIPPHEKKQRSEVIGELRALLATTCLEALEPDLIVLDEFQRFRHLMNGEGAAGALAKDLFEWQDIDDEVVRILMLSATPYKMYTTSDESVDDHYSDFLATVSFLLEDKDATEDLTQLIRQYRQQLLALADGGDPAALLATSRDIEQTLRRVMVRTEKLASSVDRDGMLKQVPPTLVLQSEDLEHYVAIQRIAKAVEERDVVEYWNSAPYVLNFMEGYSLKRKVLRALEVPADEMSEALGRAPKALLRWDSIQGYDKVDSMNPRVRDLLRQTVQTGAWATAWVPPSIPYYRAGGFFANPDVAGLTKRLVFSSWRIVPKVIATLLSYEAERRMIASHEPDAINTPDERSKRTGRAPLRLTRTEEGKPIGMPVFTLLYPSVALARLCDPVELLRGRDPAERPDALGMLSQASEVLKGHLDQLRHRAQGAAVDEAWYWAAPILLDLAEAASSTRGWLASPELAAVWQGSAHEEQETTESWAEHVALLGSVEGSLQLGAMPHNLAEVLALMALGGPATVAVRALSRLTTSAGDNPEALRTAAAKVGWSFRSLFNLPEFTAAIRGMSDKEPYWRQILQYCTDGCLQAVMDEYVHVLVESLGLFEESENETFDQLAEAISRAVGIRTTRLGVDEIGRFGSDQVEVRSHTMRTRFALRFGEEKSDEGAGGNRADHVRAAFNSPFWPFVLATTSVGQEGLDFHSYCHAIVHWNLPSNPVDLEQREGRIHRYKGHAVRKNVAKRFGREVLAGTATDLWSEMFDLAISERGPGKSDLVPFWIYCPDADGAKIERHVPSLPLSHERDRLVALKEALTIYRMVFGQPRQEDLLEYLVDKVPDAVLTELMPQLRMDLGPRRVGPQERQTSWHSSAGVSGG